MLDDARTALFSFLCATGGPPPAAEWADFAARFRPRELERFDYFVRPGETAHTVALVRSGLLRMFYARSDGKEFIKGFVRPPDFVAALESLLTGAPSRLAIQCLEPTRLYVLDYEVARAFYDRSAYWQRFGRLLVERLYVKKARREAALLMDSAAARYEAFLREHPDLAERVPDYHVASYLGITPEALSRLRNRRARENATTPPPPKRRT
jgi:CRP-like cAMP-binding protein